MEDNTIKECDDWWRFKGRVELYNKKRQSEINTPHILVFDESRTIGNGIQESCRWFKWTDSLVGDSRRSGYNVQERV